MGRKKEFTMNKLMKLAGVSVVAMSAALYVSSVTETLAKDITQSSDIEGFSKVKLSTSSDINIEMGSNYSIEMVGVGTSHYAGRAHVVFEGQMRNINISVSIQRHLHAVRTSPGEALIMRRFNLLATSNSRSRYRVAAFQRFFCDSPPTGADAPVSGCAPAIRRRVLPAWPERRREWRPRV